MRPRAAYLVWIAAAACGCAASPGYLGVERDEPSVSPPGVRAASGAQNVAAFDDAVNLAARLRYDEAADKFARVLVRFEAAGDRRRAAETMFWLGYCYEKTGRAQDAADSYQKVMQKYPDLPASSWAKERSSILTNAGKTP